MLHEPIFSPKDFERQKAEIETLLNRIPDLENRRKIVEQWQDAIEYERLQNKKEEDIQGEFLHKFFGDILGYQYGTHLEEENLRLEASTLYDFTKPDGVLGFFRNNEQQTSEVRVVIELKRYGINLDKPQNRVDFKGTPVEQAFAYASKMGDKCDWVIVSDFAEIRLYRYPNPNKYERFHVLTLLDDNNFQHFLFLLAKNQLFRKEENENNASSQAIIKRLYKGRMDFLEDITNQFYARYKQLREVLFAHIRQLNAQYEPTPLFTATQKILDRLIFMRFVSEIGLTEQNILKNVYQYNLQYLYDNTEEVAWVNIKALFNSFDRGYKANIPPFNGGLFAPDPLINKLVIKENYLKDWIKFLLDYDFQYDLKVDILGHIFEQSITDIQKLQARNFEPETEEKTNGKTDNGLPPNRKQFGVFYTPQYVTQYIVKQTIGDWLEDKKAEIIASLGVPEITEMADDFMAWQAEKPSLTIEEVEEIHLHFWQKYKQCLETITVLDPACGSGAFLNAVFDFLYEKNALAQAEINKLQAPKTPEEPQMKKKKVRKQDLFAQAQREEVQKLVSEELEYMIKRDILLTNLYGTDLNEESIEITKLSLWLKVANKRKPLPSLTDNIKRGNSLIDNIEISSYAFDWQKEFPHIFKKGGFDVLVGNPPYVRHELLGEVQKSYFSKFYPEVYNGMADLYVYFYAKGIKLLKERGTLGFITPNKWMERAYGFELRKYLKPFDIKEIVNFGELKIFEDAATEPAIVIVGNRYSNNNINYFIATNLEQVFKQNFKLQSFSKTDLGEDIWRFTNDKISSILQKFQANTISLEEYSNGGVYYGVKTGFNKAFIIDQATRDEIVKKDPKSADILRKMVEGEDFGKWNLKHAGRYMIFFPRGYNIDDYIGIKEFLMQFYDEIKPKESKLDVKGRKIGSYKWYEPQDTVAYYDLFDKPKLIYYHTALHHAFYLDTEGYYISANCYMIPNADDYLQSLLNSKLFAFVKKYLFPAFGDAEQGGRVRLDANKMNKLPIKQVDITVKKQFEEKIKQLGKLSKKPKSTDKIQQLETQLNQLIYQLYDLTAEEIELIENIN